MKPGNGYKNECRSRLIVDQLIKNHVHYFCLSPGSRNSPLLLAAAEHSQSETFVHFDERSVSFHALGFAKATGLPAVVIVTTGTAAGNLLPAVMEASAAHIPLIVLTADRPPELQDNGSNQTADQVKLFANFIRWQTQIPCADENTDDHYIATTIAQAVYRCTNSHPGPVHINVMFREPLLSAISPSRTTPFQTHYGKTTIAPEQTTLETWLERFACVEKGLITLGSLPHFIDRRSIYQLAAALNWPIFPDIISGSREDGMQTHHIPYYENIISQDHDMHPEAVLHFGDRVVSKNFHEWIQKKNPKFFGLVADHPERCDPKHLITHRLQCGVDEFCTAALRYVKKREDSTWLNLWKSCSEDIAKQLDHFFDKKEECSEPGLFHWMQAHLSQDWALFIANSMPIRDANRYFFPTRSSAPIFSNRGMSGIDGNIATAVGIAHGIKKPVVAILGDLSLLHDLNSLAQVTFSKFPIILIVVNNQGGGIFSFLNIPKKDHLFDAYLATAHDFHFKEAAALFKLAYYHLDASCDWKNQIRTCLENKNSCLIELQSCRTENYHVHQEIESELRKVCCPIQ